MNDSIDQFLDDSIHDDDEEQNFHPPIVVDRDSLGEPHHDNVIQNAKDDYEFVRKNLKQIVETNVKALEGLAKVATESESPRAYEVLSSFMKQMADANESLMKLHKDAKEITNETGGAGDDPGDSSSGTTNNYFAGSTEELLDMIEKVEQQKTKTIEGEVLDSDSDDSQS